LDVNNLTLYLNNWSFSGQLRGGIKYL